MLPVENNSLIGGPPPLTCLCQDAHLNYCDILIDTVILMLQDASNSVHHLVNALDTLKRELLRTRCDHDRDLSFRSAVPPIEQNFPVFPVVHYDENGFNDVYGTVDFAHYGDSGSESE
jgi:hypothetical protein